MMLKKHTDIKESKPLKKNKKNLLYADHKQKPPLNKDHRHRKQQTPSLYAGWPLTDRGINNLGTII